MSADPVPWSMARRTPREPQQVKQPDGPPPEVGGLFNPKARDTRPKPKPRDPVPVSSGPLLDKDEALSYLKISESYLYELLAAQKIKRVALPSVKTGERLRRMLFRRCDLDAFINAHVV